MAALVAAATAHAAVARARSTDSGNAWAAMARPCGSISPAPTPCRARAAKSGGSDGAAAHASDATTNVIKPNRSSARLPNRSPSDPAVSRTAANATL